MSNEIEGQPKVRRVGSGRTLGATSFVSITLAELNKNIANPNAVIKVSRIQMEALGFQFKPTAEPIQVQTLAPSVAKTAVQEVDFDAPTAKTNPESTVKDF